MIQKLKAGLLLLVYVTESWGQWAGPLTCLTLLSTLSVDKVEYTSYPHQLHYYITDIQNSTFSIVHYVQCKVGSNFGVVV